MVECPVYVREKILETESILLHSDYDTPSQAWQMWLIVIPETGHTLARWEWSGRGDTCKICPYILAEHRPKKHIFSQTLCVLASESDTASLLEAWRSACTDAPSQENLISLDTFCASSKVFFNPLNLVVRIDNSWQNKMFITDNGWSMHELCQSCKVIVQLIVNFNYN